MHRIFQNFVDSLSSARKQEDLRAGMAEAAAALDLSCFAYLSVPRQPGKDAGLISNYPTAWTKHYLQRHYERFDPVIIRALKEPEPFEWGLEAGLLSPLELQQELFEQAAKFGIRCGFTIPIHDHRGPIGAVTFAAETRQPQFERTVTAHGRVLQLMAVYFHAHARSKLMPDHRVVDGVVLSPREFECLEWAAKGKSAWEIGCILGISRHTTTTHLENAKAKLGVRTIVQAVARLFAAKQTTL